MIHPTDDHPDEPERAPAARARLLRLVTQDAEIELVGECRNGQEAVDAIGKHKPDLVFLDVEMPGGSGFDMLQKLGTWPFEVIFTTGFQRYAIQAIRFSALNSASGIRWITTILP